MRKFNWILLVVMFLTACATKPAAELTGEAVLPSNTPAPTLTSGPSPTPRTMEEPSPEPTFTPVEETPVNTEAPLTDFSNVTLYRTTHLMDPSNFQVSLDNWPEDLGYAVVVFVDGKIYRCDELFPQEYPNRVYCWGPAPEAETRVSLIVAREEDLEALLEIPFVVPGINTDGDG